uniref:NADH dehydrogenase subunit 6 n=1 Tax=Krisna furcata TaxID=1962556 RepID=UPI0025520AE5|nr:NADH dehydrogenase subunit 6 [Krisna furcata]WGG89430.1 NADH dehydrogenase subunit 6 [Krisna furcata]
MKMLMLKMMMMITIMTSMMKNPMSMTITLMIQTTIMIMFINMNMMSSWFPMITFLTMIGGIMIIFMYMSSISSNEKLKFKWKIMLTMITIMIPLESMMMENQIEENEMINSNYKHIEKMCSMKLYNKKSLSMCMIMVSYLLLTMITISKIVKHNEGPLRSLNYE